MIKTNLWIFHPLMGVFGKKQISAERPITMAKSGHYKWLIFENPYPSPGRQYIMAEKGTGYVLAYGTTSSDAYSNGVNRFKSEKSDSIKLTDIRQLINYQLVLLKKSIPEHEFAQIKPDLSRFQITEKPKKYPL